MSQDQAKPYFIVATDGASRGNPGRAAAGFIIKTSDGVIWVQDNQYLGIATNNEAEYRAVCLAFDRLLSDFASRLPTTVQLRTDSKLMASQLAGKFKIKNERLLKLAEQIWEKGRRLGKVEFIYNPREQNALADRLANMAIDKQINEENV